MIRIKCSNCGVMLKFRTDKLPAATVSIICPKCGTKNKVTIPKDKLKQQINPVPNPKSEEEETDIQNDALDTPLDGAMGWLVVHTENMEAKTYPLKKGTNKIGRLTSSNANLLDVRLEGDRYVSRKHCIIEVAGNRGKIGYILYEFKEKPSLNGTYLNDKKYRIKPTDELYLEDGETIQIGRTKLVLKTKKTVHNAADARQQVGKTAIAQTIIS